MNLDRSLAFTALLEWPEFGKLPVELGSYVVTEVVAIYEAHPDHNLWDTYLAYRATIGEGNLLAHAESRRTAHFHRIEGNV